MRRTLLTRPPRPPAGRLREGAKRRTRAGIELRSVVESRRGRETVAAGEPLRYWTNRARGHAQPHRICAARCARGDPTKPSVSRRKWVFLRHTHCASRSQTGFFRPESGRARRLAASCRLRRAANTSRVHAARAAGAAIVGQLCHTHDRGLGVRCAATAEGRSSFVSEKAGQPSGCPARANPHGRVAAATQKGPERSGRLRSLRSRLTAAADRGLPDTKGPALFREHRPGEPSVWIKPAKQTVRDHVNARPPSAEPSSPYGGRPRTAGQSRQRRRPARLASIVRIRAPRGELGA